MDRQRDIDWHGCIGLFMKGISKAQKNLASLVEQLEEGLDEDAAEGLAR